MTDEQANRVLKFYTGWTHPNLGPEFLNDLNAIREVEEKIQESKMWGMYLVEIARHASTRDRCRTEWLSMGLNATASHRSHAAAQVLVDLGVVKLEI